MDAIATVSPPASVTARPQLRWFRRPELGLALAALLCLAPFATKAVHIDDYLFLRAARQILLTPADPFGTTVHWYDYPMPLADVNQNPPGVSYLFALAGALFGWSEIVLHLVVFAAALGAVLGAHRLAQRFCPPPALAAGLALVTPVFWGSATTLMSDIPMLALWLWALEFWLRGLDRRQHGWFALSAALIALAGLTKYFAVALLPLLLVYTIVRERRPTLPLLWLFLPAMALVAFDRQTAALYGHGLLSGATSYARITARPGDLWQRSVILFAFLGGCLLPALFLAPRLLPRRILAAAGGVVLVVLVALTFATNLGGYSLAPDAPLRWWVIVQAALLAAGGALVLMLIVSDLRADRTADGLLLFLWAGGTVAFAGVVNWSINGRSLLPLAPVVAILVVRALARRSAGTFAWQRLWPLVPAVVIAAAVVRADAVFAADSRTAARLFHEQLSGQRATIWFQGHWGFQYYMEAAGARPLDKRDPQSRPGDYLVTPENNTNLSLVPLQVFEPAGTIAIERPFGFVTSNRDAGGGFYADTIGPLPFALSPAREERFFLSRMRPAEFWP